MSQKKYDEKKYQTTIYARDHIWLLLHYSLFVVIIHPFFNDVENLSFCQTFATLLQDPRKQIQTIAAFALGNVHHSFTLHIFKLIQPIQQALANQLYQQIKQKRTYEHINHSSQLRKYIAFIYRLQILHIPADKITGSNELKMAYKQMLIDLYQFLLRDQSFATTLDLRIVFCILLYRYNTSIFYAKLRTNTTLPPGGF